MMICALGPRFDSIPKETSSRILDVELYASMQNAVPGRLCMVSCHLHRPSQRIGKEHTSRPSEAGGLGPVSFREEKKNDELSFKSPTTVVLVVILGCLLFRERRKSIYKGGGRVFEVMSYKSTAYLSKSRKSNRIEGGQAHDIKCYVDYYVIIPH